MNGPIGMNHRIFTSLRILQTKVTTMWLVSLLGRHQQTSRSTRSRYLQTHIFWGIFARGKLQSLTSYPSAGKWIKKIWYIFYSALENNKIVTFAGKSVQLEIITLREICKTQTNAFSPLHKQNQDNSNSKKNNNNNVRGGAVKRPPRRSLHC